MAGCGDRIVAVGTDADLAAKYQAKRTIDAVGKVVMPGLINTHTHVPMVLMRGIADDLPLMDWLNQNIFRGSQNVTGDYNARERALVAGDDFGGTTTFVDVYFEDAIADEVSKAMRGVLSLISAGVGGL